jgi:hypothetical protein
MYNNSIAENHISELERQGRFGDDMLVHMNKEETTTLARMAGLDKLPINPKTGLPEAFAVMAALTAGKAILGAAQGVKSGLDASSQAKAQSKMIGQEMAGIDTALAGLEDVKAGKEDVAQAEFDQQLGFQAEEMGVAKEELTAQYQQSIQKAGFASGGASATNKAQSYRKLQQSEGRGTKSLVGQLGKSMASVEEWYAGEQGRLQSEKKRLQHEQTMANAQAKSSKVSAGMSLGVGVGAIASMFG